MFGMITSLAKAATSVVTIPVAIVADTVTGCGLTTERDEAYTATEARKLMQNLEDATNPDD